CKARRSEQCRVQRHIFAVAVLEKLMTALCFTVSTQERRRLLQRLNTRGAPNEISAIQLKTRHNIASKGAHKAQSISAAAGETKKKYANRTTTGTRRLGGHHRAAPADAGQIQRTRTGRSLGAFERPAQSRLRG